MFVVTEAEAAAIRAAFDRGGELSAAAGGVSFLLCAPGVISILRRHRLLAQDQRRHKMLNPGLGVSPAPLRSAGVGLYSAAEKSGLPVPAPNRARRWDRPRPGRPRSSALEGCHVAPVRAGRADHGPADDRRVRGPAMRDSATGRRAGRWQPMQGKPSGAGSASRPRLSERKRALTGVAAIHSRKPDDPLTLRTGTPAKVLTTDFGFRFPLPSTRIAPAPPEDLSELAPR